MIRLKDGLFCTECRIVFFGRVLGPCPECTQHTTVLPLTDVMQYGYTLHHHTG